MPQLRRDRTRRLGPSQTLPYASLRPPFICICHRTLYHIINQLASVSVRLRSVSHSHKLMEPTEQVVGTSDL